MINLHNHTKWSDGNYTILELAEYAAENGITTLGISDHFETDKTRCMLGRENIEAYVREIREAEEKIGIKILASCEVDLINITKRMAILPYRFPDNELNKLDYIFFEYAGSNFNYTLPPNPWIKGDKRKSGNSWKLFLKYRKLMEIPVFLAHPRFDLSFNEPSDAIAKVFKTINIGLELNSGVKNAVILENQIINKELNYHYHQREDIYIIAAKIGVPFITGSDTHNNLEEILQVKDAVKFLKKINGKSFY